MVILVFVLLHLSAQYSPTPPPPQFSLNVNVLPWYLICFSPFRQSAIIWFLIVFVFFCDLCRCVEHLLRNRANASKRDKQGYSPVHYAAVRGHKLALEMVQLITSHVKSISHVGHNYNNMSLLSRSLKAHILINCNQLHLYKCKMRSRIKLFQNCSKCILKEFSNITLLLIKLNLFIHNIIAQILIQILIY